MFKRIYSYLTIFTASLFFLLSCDKSDDTIENFSAKIDVSKSSLKDYVGNTALADHTNVYLLFSVDDGKTFVSYPKISLGQTYKAKVFKHTSDGDSEVKASDYFTFDWSTSQPKPNGVASSEIAEFTMQSSNQIVANVASSICTYDPSLWVGPWKGVESGTGGSGTDDNNLTQDSDNPNKITMDNFWADGVDVYMIFSPYTTYFDQIVTIPEQETSEGGVASGTGTYDQCKQIFVLDVTYVIGGKTYAFKYSFHK